MVFWSLAIAVTAIACAALYYAAAGRPVNAAAGGADAATESHFRLQLKEIGEDIAAGRLPAIEGDGARRELAREYLRAQGETRTTALPADRFTRLLPLSLVLAAGLAIGSYAYLGHPELPAAPLAGRPEAAAQGLDLDDAVGRIERQLAVTPDDVRGWTVIAPAYMQLGRYAEAEHAYRRVLALASPTADAKTDLAEALLMQNGGAMTDEPLALLKEAVALDPTHVRSRFYLAGAATRAGDYAGAKAQWTELLALGKGDEPWLAVAKEGLAAAEAGLSGAAAPSPNDAAIRAMVEGLSQRLTTSGGSLAEWTQLVRSRLVLDDAAAAQAAYDAAVAAYPDPAQRAELDALGKSGGLVVGSQP